MLVNIIKFKSKLCHSFFFLSWILGDKLIGEASRIVVAEACIQALDIDFTEGQTYEINSVEVSFQDKLQFVRMKVYLTTISNQSFYF